MVPIWEGAANAWVCLCSLKCSDGSSARRWCKVLTLSSHWANNSWTVNTNMGCKQENYMAVFWTMTGECSPTSFPCEGQTSKSTKRKNFPPSWLKNWGDVLWRVIMVNFIRARAVSIQSIGSCESTCFQDWTNELISFLSCYTSREILVKRFEAISTIVL